MAAGACRTYSSARLPVRPVVASCVRSSTVLNARSCLASRIKDARRRLRVSPARPLFAEADVRAERHPVQDVAFAVEGYDQTMVMVTHDAKAATIADRVLFLADGQIVRDIGRADEEQIMETVKEVTLT